MAKKAQATKKSDPDPRIAELYELVTAAIGRDGFVYGRRQRIVVEFYGQQHIFDAIIRSWRQVVYLYKPERLNGDMVLAIYKLTPTSFEYDGIGIVDHIYPGSELEWRWFPVVVQPEKIGERSAPATHAAKGGTAVQLSIF